MTTATGAPESAPTRDILSGMATFTIEGVGGLKQVGELLEAAAMKGAKRGLRSAALRMVGVIVNDVIPSEPRPPVDRRIYAAGFRVEPSADDMLQYDVVNTVPYAGLIEKGVSPNNVKIGRAMLAALASWAERKGLASNGVEAQRMAWAIAKSMQKKGIFGQGGFGLHIVQKALLKMIDNKYIQEEVVREVQRAVRESLR